MKKAAILSIVLFSLINSLTAQDWEKNIPKEDPDFFDIQKAFNDYYKNTPLSWVADDEWKHFKRWEAFMEPRVGRSGKMFDASATWKAVNGMQQIKAAKGQNPNIFAGAWTLLGPNAPGKGRVNCITIHPSDTNIVWIGAPGGGIWKSINGGVSWTDMSGNLPTLSVSDIVLDPNNPNIIYIATGDNRGYWWTYGWSWFSGGTYSMGVMKSTDGGLTWNPTGLSYSVDQAKMVRRLIMSPANSNILIATTYDGIWRSSDAAATWQKVKSSVKMYDAEFNISNPNLVYAVSDSVFSSPDAGITWSHISNSPIFTYTATYKRASIAVTPANPNYVYILSAQSNQPGTLYRSTDAGVNFSQLPNPTNTFYGYWDVVLEVSPTDVNTIMTGGANLRRTYNSGTAWSSAPSGYADNHDIKFFPNGKSYYVANDGGIYKGNGNSFLVDLNYGLELTQFYRMGASASNAGIIFGGAQDQNTFKMNGAAWSKVYANDGTECFVDYTNPSNVFLSSQFGNLRRSTDGGATSVDISAQAGSWTAPFLMHPTNPQTIYYGGTDAWKSTDAGTTWAKISPPFTFVQQIISMAVSKSNPNYIYAATYYKIFRTTNGGTTWTDISAGLPLSTNAISYIAISGNNSDNVWVSISGYNAGNKVYNSMNGGANWNNMSGTLPNVPVNCVEYDNNSTNDAVYVGTDVGVYYRDNFSGGWVYFNTNLPRVIISELEIHYGSNKIRAATHGRGMWESPLNTATGINTSAKPLSISVNVYPNPGSSEFFIDISSGNVRETVITVYNLTGQKITSLQSQFGNSAHFKLNLANEPEGVYIINIRSGEENYTSKIILNR